MRDARAVRLRCGNVPKLAATARARGRATPPPPDVKGLVLDLEPGIPRSRAIRCIHSLCNDAFVIGVDCAQQRLAVRFNVLDDLDAGP